MTAAGTSSGPRLRAVPQGALLAVALLTLMASAAFAALPVRADVFGFHIDCGPSLVAGRHSGEGPLLVETRLACHQAADPWRLAALATGLVSVAAGVTTTVQLRRRLPAARVAVPPPQ